METVFLSFLLMAGSSAVDSEPGSAGVRAQAVAHARIISGESISFENEDARAVTGQKLNGGRTLLLPMAHSKGAAEELAQSVIVEFH